MIPTMLCVQIAVLIASEMSAVTCNCWSPRVIRLLDPQSTVCIDMEPENVCIKSLELLLFQHVQPLHAPGGVP